MPLLERAHEAIELAQTDAAMKVVMAPAWQRDLRMPAGALRRMSGTPDGRRSSTGKPPTILDVAKRANVSKSTVRT